MKIINNTRGWLVVGLFIAAGGFGRSAAAATFSISPATGNYTVGQSITVTVRENSAGQAINAGEGSISWTPNTLQFVSVSSSSSIFKYWPVDPAVRGTSSVIFSGGLPSPGYSGSNGTVLRISFTAKAAGTATIKINDAKILANDGFGTDVYTGQVGASYTIASVTKPTSVAAAPEVPNRPTPTVSSTSHPDQLSWYREAEARLAWTKPSGLQGVSYSFTNDQATVPDDIQETAGLSTTVTVPADGVWYFHLRAKYESGWSSTSHFALHLDRTPPESFTPLIVQDRGLSDPTPVVTFTTTDALSGLAKFFYSLDGGTGIESTSPTDLTGISAGAHTLIVTAKDVAGNIREGKVGFTVEGYTAPTITFVSTPLLLLDALIVRGTANIGDTITIYANDQIIGQAVAGPHDAIAAPGVTLRVPWSFTTDQLFRPGILTITATATSRDGQVSVATDARKVRVNGQALILNGRPVATLSVVTPLVVLVIVLLLLIAAVMPRLVIAVVVMHRREEIAEEELETLREVNRRQPISRQQLDSALVNIEQDLENASTAKRPKPRRRPKKRSR